jgi:hypothetical protein
MSSNVISGGIVIRPFSEACLRKAVRRVTLKGHGGPRCDRHHKMSQFPLVAKTGRLLSNPGNLIYMVAQRKTEKLLTAFSQR